MKISSTSQTKLSIFALAATAALALSPSASANVIDVVNIDFKLGSNPNFSGKVTDAAGGTYYNQITIADSAFQIVSGSNLLTSTGLSTGSDFTIGNPLAQVASGNGGYLTPNSTSLSIDADSYLGGQGYNNTQSTTFSITGLAPGSSGNIFFQTTNNQYQNPAVFTLGNVLTYNQVYYTSTGAPFISGYDTNTYLGGTQIGNVQEFNYTDVGANGIITGTWSGSLNPGGGYYLTDLSGISIQADFVPEPGTWTMMLGSLICLGVILRRRSALAKQA